MDLIDIVRYLGALALVLALVGAAAIFVKRYGVPGVIGGKGRRLAIVEQLLLGKNVRLVIVKCDAAEHLIALGPQGATVIESKPATVAAPAPVQISAALSPAPKEDIAAEDIAA